MSQTVTFRLPMTEVISANHRLHWAVKAQRTRSIRSRARYAAQGVEPIERAHLTVQIGWPDRRKRDAHNLMPTIKACIDGIVGDAGLLPGDDDRYLTGPDLRPYLAGIRGQVVLGFEFTEALP